MRMFSNFLTEHKTRRANLFIGKRMSRVVSSMSEIFWFSLSFFLFLVLGPFSAIAVIAGLWNLAGEHRDKMIEPASV
ncbi:hypothetical protein [Desulfolithobacter sp.]